MSPRRGFLWHRDNMFERSLIRSPLIWDTVRHHVERMFRGPGSLHAHPISLRVGAHEFGIRSEIICGGKAVLVGVSALPVTEQRDRLESVCTRYGLTRRQGQVALLLRERLTNAEIADELKITRATVKRHCEVALLKLGASGRHEVRAILDGG
jgi:DNA-binding CsgD family transcriptional regulator